MSTNNFSYDNILVVCPDFSFEDDDFQTLEFDDVVYNEYIDNMRSELSKIGFSDDNKFDNDRNYAGHIISNYGLEDKDGMIVYIEVIVRNGYYDGQNIDFIIDGDFGIENKQNKKQVAHYHAMHNKLNKKIEQCRKVLIKHGGKEYLKVAQFSNGEAVYEIKK